MELEEIFGLKRAKYTIQKNGYFNQDSKALIFVLLRGSFLVYEAGLFENPSGVGAFKIQRELCFHMSYLYNFIN